MTSCAAVGQHYKYVQVCELDEEGKVLEVCHYEKRLVDEIRLSGFGARKYEIGKSISKDVTLKSPESVIPNFKD